MLELRDIRKQYTTGSFTQVALDGVSLSFRDNEFVAILGPSGSGKTTLLNVVGGLDHFDAGDLLIDGISTRKYRDRDWDAYRNNRIGFVFQSYNLIPHQSVLANVELALTLSGVSASERRERARAALEQVGLGQHVNKRPNQLSGGQMQRVAIARALINDPEILLADEPTGALDSHTSVQVMDLLKEVARDRLVIMVTHNPDLAHEYATRIVELSDGRVTSDSDPFDPESAPRRVAKQARRTRMSFLTALSLSFNNLMTKKGRTIMTAFAGSIGIIGIAAILALANGVNEYIDDVERDTLSIYPLTIQSSGIDLTSMMAESAGVDSSDSDGGGSRSADADEASATRPEGTVETHSSISRMFSSVGKNDLASLKVFLDGNGGGINQYVRHIDYTYDITPQIFLADTSDGVVQVNPDAAFSTMTSAGMSSLMTSSLMTTNVFKLLPGNPDIYTDQYDVLAGRWPTEAHELVLVLGFGGYLSDLLEYDMGLRNHAELDSMVRGLQSGDDVVVNDTGSNVYTYEQLMEPTFALVHACDMYQYEPEYGVWTNRSDDPDFMRDLVESGEELRIVGVVQPKDDEDATSLSSGIYFLPDLVFHVMDTAAASDIVRAQLDSPDVDVFSGKTFDELAEDEGTTFDMSTLITIDGSTISQAITFDTGALSLDLSGLDLSGIDVSGFSMPSLDLSSLSFDTSQLPELSAEDLAEVFPELTGDDLVDILASVEIHFTEGGVERLNQTIEQIVSGYAAYQAENPDATIADYMASVDVRGMIAGATADLIDTADLERQLVAAIAAKLGIGSGGGASGGQVEPDEGGEPGEGGEPTEPGEGGAVEPGEGGEPSEGEDPSGSGDASGVPTDVSGLTQEIISRLLSKYVETIAASLGRQISTAIQAYMQTAVTQMMTQMSVAVQQQIVSAMEGAMSQLASGMANALNIDEATFASAFQFNLDERQLTELMTSLMKPDQASYERNLSTLCYGTRDKPSEIAIYPLDFESKGHVVEILDGYNDEMREVDEDKVITYTDIVGALMSSVTRIVDMISAMLIAFVSISLIVSSIMIGIITYISVLERKKEIGILRSIGASKRDVANVFNAETVIEGLIAGIMGVGITYLISIPANAIVYQRYGVERIARLPVRAALLLVALSVVLTVIAGFLPARKASKSDPVEALRSE